MLPSMLAMLNASWAILFELLQCSCPVTLIQKETTFFLVPDIPSLDFRHIKKKSFLEYLVTLPYRGVHLSVSLFSLVHLRVVFWLSVGPQSFSCRVICLSTCLPLGQLFCPYSDFNGKSGFIIWTVLFIYVFLF